MTPDRDIEELVERWLKDDAPPMPAQLRSAVRKQVAIKPQLQPSRRVELERRWGTWFVRGGFAAAAAGVVVVVASALTALNAPSIGAASPTLAPDRTVPSSPVASLTPDPFSGIWSTIDVDGSRMTAEFSGSGPTREYTFDDFRATYCAGGTYEGRGTGTIDGDSIHVAGTAGCVIGGIPTPFSDGTYTYMPASGTLESPFEYSGGDRLIWTRGPTQPDAFSGP